MQKRWLVLAGCCFLASGLGVSGAKGQDQPQSRGGEARAQVMEEIRLTRTAIQIERQALVTMGMDLTPDEMQKFWPLYREYRLEAVQVGDRIVSLITTYADNYQNLTDEVADKLLTEFVSVETARARLKAKYLPKFKRVLPPRKVARFYQLENKLDIAILAEMAEHIPLAR